MRRLFYPGTDVVLVFFDTTCRDSFEALEYEWIPEKLNWLPDIPWILVGTKSDLLYDTTCEDTKGTVPVKQQDITALCKKYNFEYFETSAITGDGVEACLFAAAAAGVAFKYGKNNIPLVLKINVLENGMTRLKCFHDLLTE
ncbi:ras-like GTP-binding protein RHO [Mytilus californianus]|uniref:ras-like GTP-binding protein RHO n=1 Tax=Mytilus californianus TaxID=6549 RepID=UPI0022457143|nr:ras-like GTP-binding protein RHO [Mytilus californianus]